MRAGLRLLRDAGQILLAAALAVAVLCVPDPAFARPFEPDTTPLRTSILEDGAAGEAQSVSSGGGAIVRLIVGLAIVLAVIYGVYWLLKAYRRAKTAGSDSRIEIVATTALGPNRSVHLLRVGDELVLVGSAEHGVTKIRVYRPDEAQRLAPLLEGRPGAQGRGLAAGRDGTRSMLAGAIDDLRRRTVRG